MKGLWGSRSKSSPDAFDDESGYAVVSNPRFTQTLKTTKIHKFHVPNLLKNKRYHPYKPAIEGSYTIYNEPKQTVISIGLPREFISGMIDSICHYDSEGLEIPQVRGQVPANFHLVGAVNEAYVSLYDQLNSENGWNRGLMQALPIHFFDAETIQIVKLEYNRGESFTNCENDEKKFEYGLQVTYRVPVAQTNNRTRLEKDLLRVMPLNTLGYNKYNEDGNLMDDEESYNYFKDCTQAEHKAEAASVEISNESILQVLNKIVTYHSVHTCNLVFTKTLAYHKQIKNFIPTSLADFTINRIRATSADEVKSN
jgi:hypothetical protein